MIRFDRVTIQLGKRRILDEESFQLHQGVPHVLLGESGSGKTTILKVMLGLIRPVAGRVYLDHVDITTLPESKLLPLRKKVAMVFQSGALFDGLTVGENVGYRLFEAGCDAREVEDVVREKLRLVGLEESINLYPAELSGGMAKRVAIARALAAAPEIILFDEPTSGLDPIAVCNLKRLILSLHGSYNITPLVVTHDVQSAMTIGHRFSVLQDGKFLFQGTRDELERTEHEHVREFLSPTAASLDEWALCQEDGRQSVVAEQA